MAKKEDEVPAHDPKAKKPVAKKAEPAVEKPPVKAKAKKVSKEAVCKHPKTKRVLDRRARAVHVCTNPKCNKIVKVGAR